CQTSASSRSSPSASPRICRPGRSRPSAPSRSRRSTAGSATPVRHHCRRRLASGRGGAASPHAATIRGCPMPPGGSSASTGRGRGSPSSGRTPGARRPAG
ncbi:MAG: hypothetical protein AVDCRST_MAG18-4171, partial [uncultured Thermomicrobiales bacterium]